MQAATIHYVTQEVSMSEVAELQLPVQIVMEADVERRMLMDEAAELEANKGSLTSEQEARVAAVHERMVVIGAESAEGRANALLVNLGFSDELLLRQMNQLSGGWRVRVALAAALFAKPDILLLDEPTNHLSIDAVLWLQNELATSSTWASRIIITVSHDRAFLDAVVTDCMHISGAARRVTQTRGTYTLWAKRRAQDQDTWRRSQEQRAAKRVRGLVRHLLPPSPYSVCGGAVSYSHVPVTLDIVVPVRSRVNCHRCGLELTATIFCSVGHWRAGSRQHRGYQSLTQHGAPQDASLIYTLLTWPTFPLPSFQHVNYSRT